MGLPGGELWGGLTALEVVEAVRRAGVGVAWYVSAWVSAIGRCEVVAAGFPDWCICTRYIGTAVYTRTSAVPGDRFYDAAYIRTRYNTFKYFG